jgi:hypothetical protein
MLRRENPLNGILILEDTAKEKSIVVARTVGRKQTTRTTEKTTAQVTAASLQIWKNRKRNGGKRNENHGSIWYSAERKKGADFAPNAYA